MGGEVGVSSRKGAGSTFWCSLSIPLDLNKPIPQHEPAQYPSAVVVAKCPVLAENLRALAADWGLAIDVVSDPSSAGGQDPHMEIAKPVRPLELLTLLRANSQTSAPQGITADLLALSQAVLCARSVRVLVAEDNLVNQKVAKALLEKLGCQVDVVANGREALDLWSQLPYDAIFMDCQMPEMDGFAATRAIRAREEASRHTPIIAVTANALKGDRQACLDAGMDDYVTKPIRLSELRATIDKYCPEGPPVFSK
ncbi:MAG: response regulator [Acidobacteria bacterium]|nr:response regulator [Acidobacteriota bacterium]